jgi:hypothetical protein
MNGSAAVIDITPESVAALALPIHDQAKALSIVDLESLKRGNELLLNIKDIRKQIADTFDPLAAKAHEAHKAILAEKKKAEAPLIEAEGIVKPAIARFMAEEERKRREEEARLAEIARKQAEEMALAAAIEAEEAGAPPEEVDAIAAAPVFVPTVAPPPPPKLSGVSIRKVVKFEVTDLRALVKAVAAGQVPIEALQPNDVVIGAQARSLRGSLRWPGVRVWEEDSVAAGRR